MNLSNTESNAISEQRWNALMQRQQDNDSPFFYGVLTTGIYCRPTCASRMPNRENVRFFDRSEDAIRAGFRPCKRCAPDQETAPETQHKTVLHVCRLIQSADMPLSLQELADAVGWSPTYLHRIFKAAMGVTPKQYAHAERLERVRRDLRQSPTVTDALANAGYAKSSQFYEKGMASLGMTPSTYKKGGKGMMIRYAAAPCALGIVLVAATPKGICRIDLGDDAERLTDRLQGAFPQAQFCSDDAEFAAWIAQVVTFLEAPKRGLSLPLDVQGTAFQQRVWAALQAIPAGATTTYTDIAIRIGNPKAVRAVAGACAANTLAVAIPCHRVIRSDGDLSGYRWGIERKRTLLEQEAKHST